jgi:poly(hydroxyalkanoate) granule-associated protein
MAKVEVKVNEAEDEAADEVRSPLFEVLRRVALASVGAVALAQDAAEDLVNRLVERGEIAEEDGKRLVREMREKRQKQVSTGPERAAEELDRRMREVLNRMNVPTKTDIDELSAKITTLSEKVDELKE